MNTMALYTPFSCIYMPIQNAVEIGKKITNLQSGNSLTHFIQIKNIELIQAAQAHIPHSNLLEQAHPHKTFIHPILQLSEPTWFCFLFIYFSDCVFE